MTPEQEAAVEAVGDAIRNDPRPWSQLTTQEQAVLHAGLMPHPSFSEEQADYLHRWWLRATPEQVEQLNALCPPGTRIEARLDESGAGFIGADLLSDALDGGRLNSLLPILSELQLNFRTEVP